MDYPCEPVKKIHKGNCVGGYFTEGQNDRIQDCVWITPK